MFYNRYFQEMKSQGCEHPGNIAGAEERSFHVIRLREKRQWKDKAKPSQRIIAASKSDYFEKLSANHAAGDQFRLSCREGTGNQT